MSKTSIEWYDYSWNPTTGCTMGCKNWYACRLVNHFQKKWGYDFAPRLHPERLKKHDNWPAGSKVFVCDTGDLFDPQASYACASQVVAECERHPEVTFQFLIKQVKRMAQLAQDRHNHRNLPPNIWWGCTVRNQQEADERIPELLKLKHLGASVLYISAEPLLGPIEIGIRNLVSWGGTHELDWIICGGETGPGARPMHPGWARGLKNQCVEAGVPFFFKHWGEWIPKQNQNAENYKWGVLNESGEFFAKTTPWNGREGDPRDDCEYVMLKAGRKNAGRLLDGEEWHQFPNAEDEGK